jgi:N-acetylglucosamine-6-phosphate deacetylase
MASLLFENALLFDPELSSPTPGGILVEGERIAARLERPLSGDHDAARRDLGGLGIAPGFVDLHFHGQFVFSADDARDDAIHGALIQAASLSCHGTTAYLATTVAARQEALAAQVEGLARALDGATPDGARPIGLHLEGPWINELAAGAQPLAGIRSCRIDEANDLLDRAAGWVRMLTFAPEIAGTGQLLDLLAQRGVVAALGHSRASAERVDDAVTRGARHVTHLFNAMGALHHREPGLAGMALADDRLSADLICDGVHVDRRVVQLAARALGSRMMLITDRIDPDPDAGEASFGSGALNDDGKALRLPDGRLAGSRLTLDVAVRNAMRFADLPLLDAIAACTLRPARLLGLEAELGTLRPGARADFVVLDKDGAVLETWVGGRCVHPG